MNNSWSENVWQKAEPIYKAIEQMPFIQELCKGTLPQENYLFYIKQDTIYLTEYGKILSGISSKLQDINDRNTFLHFSLDSIICELEQHNKLIKNAVDLKFTQASPACQLYTGFLSQMLLSYPVETAMAAILPCFKIYRAIGKYLISNKTDNNPYQSWIDTYNSDIFDKSTIEAETIISRYAEKSEHSEMMTQAYLRACRREYMFWDSAYNKENWIF